MARWGEVLERARKLVFGRLTGPQRALLAVVRPVPDAEYPLDEVSRLDEAGRIELLGLLRRHGLTGWAHRVYGQAGIGLSDDLAGPLRIAHATNTAQGVLALSAYERLSSVLSRAGVDHIPLKGVRLLETLYPDPGTRQLSDLDVLVREGDVERADEALRAAGYRGEDAPTWRRAGRYHHHHGYAAPPPFPIHVEVHWKLSAQFELRRGGSWVWEEAQAAPGAAAGSREFVLAPAVELHGLVLHLANHAYQLSLKWILDLRLLLERWEEADAPGTLAARAAAAGSAGACALVLGLVAEVGGSRAAAGFREACLARTGWTRRAAARVLARPDMFLERAAWLREKWPHYALTVGLADRVGDMAAAAARAVRFKLDLERSRRFAGGPARIAPDG